MDILANRCQIPISFGGAAISGEAGGYGFGNIDDLTAIDLLKSSFDQGIKIYDTAPIYGFGTSEKRVGQAFKNIRDQVFIVDKSGITWHDNGRVNLSNEPQVTQKMLEQSLRDLQSDYIDLYMVHWPDPRVDIRKPFEVLAKAKMDGKIRHLGLCNTTIEEIEKASEIECVEVVQSEFSFTESKSELFDYFKKHQILFMSWGTFDKGIISGTVSEKRKYDKADARSWAPWWKKSNYKEKVLKMKYVLQFLEEQGHSGLELALGHNLFHCELWSAICGVRSRQQLDSLIKALDHLPSGEIIEQALKIYHEN